MKLHGPPGLALRRTDVGFTETEFRVRYTTSFQEFFFARGFHRRAQTRKVPHGPLHLLYSAKKVSSEEAVEVSRPGPL